MKQIGRFQLSEGRWPIDDNEIVMEPNALSNLGCDYTLGQEISIVGKDKNIYTYTLVGILKTYTDLWIKDQEGRVSLPNAILTSEGIKPLSFVYSTYFYVKLKPKYFENEILRNKSEVELQELLSNYVAKIIIDEAAQEQKTDIDFIFYNKNEPILAFEKDNNTSNFYIAIISLIAFSSVMCIFLLNRYSEIKTNCTLRCIGISTLQMCELAFYGDLNT